MNEQKGVKNLGALMQQVCIEMKRMVHLGLRIVDSVNRTKHHSFTDLFKL